MQAPELTTEQQPKPASVHNNKATTGFPNVRAEEIGSLLPHLQLIYSPAKENQQARGEIKIKVPPKNELQTVRTATPRVYIPFGLGDNSKFAKGEKVKYSIQVSLANLEHNEELKALFKYVLAIETWIVKFLTANKEKMLPMVEDDDDDDQEGGRDDGDDDESGAAKLTVKSKKMRCMTDKEIKLAFKKGSAVKPGREVEDKVSGEKKTYPAMLKFKCRQDRTGGMRTTFWQDNYEDIDGHTGLPRPMMVPFSAARTVPGTGGLEAALIICPESVWFMGTGAFGIHWYVNQVHIYHDRILSGARPDVTSTYAFTNVLSPSPVAPNNYVPSSQLTGQKHARDEEETKNNNNNTAAAEKRAKP